MISFTEEPGKLTCTFTGKMDTDTSMTISAEIEEKLSHCPKQVIFDLDGVDYVASAFLRICLQAQQALEKEKLLLINVTPAVKKVFMIAGFDRLMNIA